MYSPLAAARLTSAKHARHCDPGSSECNGRKDHRTDRFGHRRSRRAPAESDGDGNEDSELKRLRQRGTVTIFETRSPGRPSGVDPSLFKTP